MPAESANHPLLLYYLRDMERGFWIILIGIAIIALGYAALSIWPVFIEAQPPAGSSTAQGPGITPPTPVSPRTGQTNPGQPAASQPQAGGASTTAQGSTPTRSPATAGGSLGPAAASGSAVNRRIPSPPMNPAPGLLTGQPPEPPPEPAGDTPQLMYTRESVKLYIEPNGRPHHPTSLNNSPLIIGRGSHVLPLEYRDGWVMVRSPGHTLGWLHGEDLTATPPVSVNQEILN